LEGDLSRLAAWLLEKNLIVELHTYIHFSPEIEQLGSSQEEPGRERGTGGGEEGEGGLEREGVRDGEGGDGAGRQAVDLGMQQGEESRGELTRWVNLAPSADLRSQRQV
jgi:hypothetical protein